MISKTLGAVLILVGCGSFGMMICLSYKREEDMLRQLIRALDLIHWELQYRLTPLPELCALAAKGCSGTVSRYFYLLSKELTRHTSPDARSIASAVGECFGAFPVQVDKALEILAVSLGQFDVQGQLQGLEAARNHCRSALETMANDRDVRLRSYQTLGICAGAALVILLV